MLTGEIVWISFSTNPDYIVLTEDGLYKVIQEDTQSEAQVGEFITVKGTPRKNEVYATEVEMLEGEREGIEKAKIEAFLKKECKAFDFELLAEDEVMLKLVKPLKHAAEFMQKEIMRCTPVINRFHNDPDGATSGILLKNALLEFAKEKNPFYEAKWISSKQADSAIFEMKNVHDDVETAKDFCKKPVLSLVDHGANTESVHALEEAHKNGFKIMIIDHHPYAQEAKSLSQAFVSAREFGGGSIHCGGLLSYEFALALSGKADKKLAEIAMEGDKSTFFKGHLHETLALDYLVTKGKDLKKYEKVLADKHLVELNYLKATQAIKKAGEIAHENTTHVIAGRGKINLVYLKPLHKLTYPPKGTSVQEVHKHFEGKDYPVVTIGYDDERCIFRVNSYATFKANETIGKIRKEFGSATPSGGGHEKAASMRMQIPRSKEILERVVEEVKKELEGQE